MTQYNAQFPFPVLYPPVDHKMVLAEALASEGVTQFHCAGFLPPAPPLRRGGKALGAETEKYAHVTFFFNGGKEVQFEGEERGLLPSPKEVPTYDHKPEMNCAGVADKVFLSLPLFPG